MYKMLFIMYYLLPIRFDPFCSHHEGSFTWVLRLQQTAILYKWNHCTL